MAAFKLFLAWAARQVALKTEAIHCGISLGSPLSNVAFDFEISPLMARCLGHRGGPQLVTCWLLKSLDHTGDGKLRHGAPAPTRIFGMAWTMVGTVCACHWLDLDAITMPPCYAHQRHKLCHQLAGMGSCAHRPRASHSACACSLCPPSLPLVLRT
jgi:hypothetical protein